MNWNFEKNKLVIRTAILSLGESHRDSPHEENLDLNFLHYFVMVQKMLKVNFILKLVMIGPILELKGSIRPA